MSRQLSTPLTEDDLEFLNARYSEAYVARQVELHTPLEAENVPEKDEEGGADPVAPPAPEEPGEDLIGEVPVDPGKLTVDEVLAHLRSADEAERARVLAAEQAGKARAGILKG